jgi:hypothetical protein
LAGIRFVKVVEAGPRYTTVLGSDGKTYTLKGDRNWRNNNPGNLEYGAFAKAHGAIGSDGRFAVFPDVETGSGAQVALQFSSPKYAGKSILEAIGIYAPKTENDTDAYANALAYAAGVPVSTQMGALTPEQQQAYLAAQRKVEGFKVGTVTDASGNKLDPSIFNAGPAPPYGLPGYSGVDQAPTLPVMPPPPRPRPDPPGGFAAPPPLIPPAPQGTPWDIPGILNVGKEMALKPDAAGHYPTMASGYINRALANAVPSVPQIQQTAQAAVAPTVNAVNKAKDTALNLGSSLGNSLSGLGNMFGGMFGGSPASPAPPAPAVPAPPNNYGLPGYSGRDVPAPGSSPDKAAADKAMKDFIAAAMASRSNYGLPGYSGNDVAPSTLPLPAPPPLMPPMMPPTVPTAPLGHPGTPPGTPLHMTTVPFIPPPPPPVQIATGKMVPVGTVTPHGGTVQGDGSIKFNWGVVPGPKPAAPKGSGIAGSTVGFKNGSWVYA